ncbi:MAG: helix-turn-helix transcriptional regulator [Saprospiraceae bacterium]
MAKKTFGFRLKSARENKKLSKSALGKNINVGIKNVMRWENDEVAPSIYAVINLAKALDVSIDHLAGLEKRSDSHPLLGLLAMKLDKLSVDQKKALKTILNAF